MKVPNSISSVRAVDRALDILLCFANAQGGLTLSGIARETGLHKSTAHRLLVSLQQKGFVRKDTASEKYLLGWGILELTNNLYKSDELSTLVLPEMTLLRNLTGETVSLYIRSGTERIRIQAVESSEPIRNVAHIGTTYPLYIGASGKVLLAFAKPDVLGEILESAFPTDMDVQEFMEQLRAVQRDGHAISIQERDAGAAAIAVPIFGRNHDLVASLSVSGPVSRFTLTRMNHHVGAVKEAAERITQQLAH